ncbi:MAG: preprotein translocase subunit SecD [Rhodobacteraceae bacterium HLUCCA08]|nr:MAG: preprotein translocase subunit SecD [Rhodobacteraceae bacterium HLUCCA08]
MLQIDLWKRILVWTTVAVGLALAAPNLFYERVERSNDAEAVLEDGVTAAELERTGKTEEELLADAAAWPSFLPDGLVNLGLDLRGGAHLLAEVKVTDVHAQRMEALWPDVRDLLAAERETVGFVTQDEDAAPGTLRVVIANPEGIDRALELVRGLARPVQSAMAAGARDLDVRRDGPDAILIQLSEAEIAETDNRTVAQALEIIRRRIDEVGTREPNIQRQGEDRVLVQVPGVESAEEVKEIIGTTAQLSFQPVVRAEVSAEAVPGIGNEILPALDDPSVFYELEQAPVVTGDELVDSQPSTDQNGRPAVSFRFNPTGARKFGDYTADNVGALFAIVLDNEVVSAPRISQHIPGGSGIITSRTFTPEETVRMSVLLRAGALPAELDFLEERTIGPELGQDSIEAGRIATMVAFAAVLVFMVLSYGMFGVFANIALTINLGLIFGLLSLLGATLTLPGIAGIVLTVGMAVDANVLVFERIREELKTAKGPARAIELGYEKALSAILDANITTFITALILFFMGSGPVRGFAITLGLGILTSVFTAIFVTRLLVVIWFERRRPKTIEV